DNPCAKHYIDASSEHPDAQACEDGFPMKEIRLLSIQVGLPQAHTAREMIGPAEKSWVTSFFKQPVTGQVWLGKTNLDGDRQAAKTHGGTEKAVCAYPFEHYSRWQHELGLPALDYGAFGENFTLQGLLEDEVCIGDVFAIGDATVQVSQPRPPCWRLARWWQIKDFALRMEATGLTGWYFRVIKEGYVQAGARIELTERHHPRWSVAAANKLMYGRDSKTEDIRALSACVMLSEGWREELSKRISKSAG
ncbi:MAG TPA: MOSC domain-containing protein, partial [Blastocatellia bacterium]